MALAAALSLLTYVRTRPLAFDHSIENMFSPRDPLLPPYQQLKRTFGGNEIVLAVYHDEALLSEPGLARLREVTSRLREVEGLRDVLSLSDLEGVLKSLTAARALGGLLRNPFAKRPPDAGSQGSPLLREGDPLAGALRELFEGYTHGADGQTASIACMLEPQSDAAARRRTLQQIEAVIQSLPAPLAPGAITGEPVMVTRGFELVEQDGRRLAVASTWLLAVTIAVCFRSFRWLLIPILVVQCSLLWTRGLLAGLQLQLSMVSSMLTAIVTVIGVATVVHVIVRYGEQRRRGAERTAALRGALSLLLVPIFWSCLTDAVGFLALLAADVGPVRDFGVMTAAGTLMVLLSVALVIPATSIWGRWDADPHPWAEARISRSLSGLSGLARRFRGTVLIGLGVLLAVAVAGVSRLQVETDFTRNFAADSPLVLAYEEVETHLGGAGVLDVILPAPESVDAPYLAAVRELEQALRELPGADGRPALSKVISLADAEAAVREAGGVLSGVGPGARLAGMRAAMPAFSDALWGTDPETGRRYFRIMLRARERQPAERKLALIRDVRHTVAQAELPGIAAAGESPAGEVTGFFVLLTNLIKSMVRDQWLCFGIATLAIGCMMAVAFRSVPLALIALCPNALPILVLLGAMGWLGVRINMGAAMIAAVSMGLAVDSSIHYLISYQRAVRLGASAAEAVGEVQQTVGRAMLFSTLALMVGFAILASSEFVPTVYFGVLVTLSMLGGLLGNLILLPLLLSLLPERRPGR